jgi:hypothetical protein
MMGAPATQLTAGHDAARTSSTAAAGVDSRRPKAHLPKSEIHSQISQEMGANHV